MKEPGVECCWRPVMGMGGSAARGRTRGTVPLCWLHSGDRHDWRSVSRSWWGGRGDATRSVLGEIPEQLCSGLHRFPQAQGALVGLSCEREVHRGGRGGEIRSAWPWRGGEAGWLSLLPRRGCSLRVWLGKEKSMLREFLFYYSIIFMFFPSICSSPFSPGQELLLPLRQNVSELINWDSREEYHHLQVKKLALGIGFLFLSSFVSFCIFFLSRFVTMNLLSFEPICIFLFSQGMFKAAILHQWFLSRVLPGLQLESFTLTNESQVSASPAGLGINFWNTVSHKRGKNNRWRNSFSENLNMWLICM